MQKNITIIAVAYWNVKNSVLIKIRLNFLHFDSQIFIYNLSVHCHQWIPLDILFLYNYFNKLLFLCFIKLAWKFL